MFYRTTLGATLLLALTSLAQAQSRCEYTYRAPRDMPVCTLKQENGRSDLDPAARNAVTRTPHLPARRGY